MTELTRALRYPWRGKGWLLRMMPMALWQLVPLIGQIILIGYGQAIVRETSRQQRNLPSFHLRQSFLDGLQLTCVGCVYCFPAILMVLFTFSSIDTPKTETSGGVPGIIYPVTMFIWLRISSEIAKRRPALKSILSVTDKIVKFLFFAYIITKLYSLFSVMQGGIQFSTTVPLDSTVLMTLLAASLLSAVIAVALLVSGTRFAITGSGLLKPSTTIQLMTTNFKLTVRFMFTVWLLVAGTIVAAAVGTVFLLVPGLLLLVAGNASIWFLAAQYVNKIGVKAINPLIR